MTPGELVRVIERAECPDDLEKAGLKLWKVGDQMVIDDVPIVLTDVVVVQDATLPKHGRIVFFAHQVGDEDNTVSGSFPILFPASSPPGKDS